MAHINSEKHPDVGGQTFLKKGLLIVSLPLVVGSAALIALTAWWMETTTVAAQAEKRVNTIKLVDHAFLSLIERGYKQFGNVFNARPNTMPPRLPSARTALAGEDKAVQALGLECEDIEFAVDRQAKLLQADTFHSNAERLLSYRQIIARTLAVADNVDRFLAEQSKVNAAFWQAWEMQHARLLLLSLAAFAGAMLVAGGFCLYFSYDLLKRIHLLAVKAISLSSLGYSSAQVAGDDELAFLGRTFEDVAAALSASVQERALLAEVVGANILKPVAAARDCVRACLTGAIRADRVAESVRVVDSAFARIDRFVADLLTVNAGEPEQQKPDCLSYFSVQREADVLVGEITPLAEKKMLSVKNEVGNIYLLADQAKFSRVLANLLGNAVKFSPSGSCVRITSQTKGEALVICVLDEGPGLSEQDSRRIFDPYYQSEGAKGQGFGLGLSICRTLVKQMHGTIGQRNRRGGGSEFWFAIPPAAATLTDNEPVSTALPEISFSLKQSVMARRFLGLLLVPLLCQIFSFVWLYQPMEAASALLARTRRQEELNLVLSRSWVNLFSAGYGTALYLSNAGTNYEPYARRHIKQLRDFLPVLEPQPVDGNGKDAAMLRELCANTVYQCAALEEPLERKQISEAQNVIGTFAFLLNSAAVWTVKMSKVLESQFLALETLALEQKAARGAVLSTLLALLAANVLIGFWLAFRFARTFAVRIKDLVVAARGIPEGLQVEHPQSVVDEIDKLQDLLAVGCQRLARENDEREALVSAIAHDIRSPLQSINIVLAGLEKAAEAGGRLPEQFEEVRGRLFQASSQVDDLLALNKLKQSAPAQRQELAVAELLLEAVADVAEQAESKDVFLDLLDPDDNRAISLSGDGEQLRKLFVKLLSLAVANAPAHSQITIAPQGPDFTLVLEDQGPPFADCVSLPANPVETYKRDQGRYFELSLALAVCQQFCLLNGLRLSLAGHTSNQLRLSCYPAHSRRRPQYE